MKMEQQSTKKKQPQDKEDEMMQCIIGWMLLR